MIAFVPIRYLLPLLKSLLNQRSGRLKCIYDSHHSWNGTTEVAIYHLCTSQDVVALSYSSVTPRHTSPALTGWAGRRRNVDHTCMPTR
eukprot:360874-Chlamydomonas_euryale.AAC.13